MHVFAFIYIHNKYTQYTRIYYVNKQCLTALVFVHILG